MFLVSLMLCQYQVALQPILWGQDVKWSLQKAFRRLSEDFQDALLKFVYSVYILYPGEALVVYIFDQTLLPI